jgi:hypothetical protein
VQHAGWQLNVVDDVQQGHGNDEGTEKPVGHINVAHFADAHGAKEHKGKCHPDHRNQHIDRPNQFCVLLALGQTQGQGDGGQDDDQLPSPECEGSDLVVDQAHVAGTLNHVISGGKQATTAKRKNDSVGMQGSQTTVAEPGNAEIEFRPGQLGCNDHAHQHAHHTPNHRHDGELPDNFVVVGRRLHIGKLHFYLFYYKNYLTV